MEDLELGRPREVTEYQLQLPDSRLNLQREVNK